MVLQVFLSAKEIRSLMKYHMQFWMAVPAFYVSLKYSLFSNRSQHSKQNLTMKTLRTMMKES